MLQRLQKRWKLNSKNLLLVLCVFAVTGTATAIISRNVTGWMGFTEDTHWSWKLALRLAVLIFGYQVILLSVAFLFGQFSFFWAFEKRFLAKLGIIKTEEKTAIQKKSEENNQ